MVKKSRFFMFLLLFCALSLGASAGRAEEDIQKKIDQTKKKLTQTKVKEKSVLGKLLSNQKELDKVSTNLSKLTSRVGDAERRIKSTKSELGKAEEDLVEVRSEISGEEEVLNQRLVAIYKYGYQSYLEVLFQAKNFGEFITRFELVGNFVNNDLQLLKKLQGQLAEIEDKKKLISEKQSELEQEKKVYSRLHLQTKSLQQKWLEKVADQQEELAAIQNDRRKLEAALDELERLSKSMESQIRDIQNKNRGNGIVGTGQMIWPVSGRVTSYFGYRMHPILKKRKYHSGIDIAAPSGTPIIAADTGEIIFCGSNGGYGKMITIDHGNGISTVYAHCSALLVELNQKVEKGQRIALVGSTGLSTGPHCHFEVRKNGVPFDPMSQL